MALLIWLNFLKKEDEEEEVQHFCYLLRADWFLLGLCPGVSESSSFLLSELSTRGGFLVFCDLCFFSWSRSYFSGNGDTDAEIFPHIRCRLPSLHLYLAALLTFPSGLSTVVRDYRHAAPLSPLFFYLTLPSTHFLSLFFLFP